MFSELILIVWGNIYLIIGTLLVAIVYYGVIRNWNYFTSRNVAFKRGIPMIASNYKFFIGQEDFMTSYMNYYNEFPDNRFCGMYEFHNPIYMIRDPELIKQIAIKDFDYFRNHRGNIDEHADPLMGRTLFFMTDQRWKEMRTTLSPVFTGSKMRMMFSILVDVMEHIITRVNEKVENGTSEYDMKDLISRIGTDIISAASFGLHTDSIDDSDMYRNCKIATNFDGLQAMKLFGFLSIPNVMKFLGVKLFPAHVTDYFRSIILGAFKQREESNVNKPDMINLLLEAKRGTLKYSDDAANSNVGFATVEESNITKTGATLSHWTDDDLIAQCMIFFFAGFDSASTVLNFMSYEICSNPDIQNRLYDEITKMNGSLEGRKLKYEDIQKMKYLDMVVSETLRRYTPAQATSRVCSKPYQMTDYNGNTVTIEEGQGIWIPVYCLHNDPKYWKEPTKFNPDRFSDENKHNINPDTFIAFGSGPRNCIGSRFALMQVKAITYYLLLNFRFERCDRTPECLKFKKGSFNVKTEKQVWIKLVKRD